MSYELWDQGRKYNRYSPRSKPTFGYFLCLRWLIVQLTSTTPLKSGVWVCRLRSAWLKADKRLKEAGFRIPDFLLGKYFDLAKSWYANTRPQPHMADYIRQINAPLSLVLFDFVSWDRWTAGVVSWVGVPSWWEEPSAFAELEIVSACFEWSSKQAIAPFLKKIKRASWQ